MWMWARCTAIAKQSISFRTGLRQDPPRVQLPFASRRNRELTPPRKSNVKKGSKAMQSSPQKTEVPSWNSGELKERIAALDPWFHNLRLQGIQTAPDHFLGDYPEMKWQSFRHALPEDLSGKRDRKSVV